MNLVIGGVVLLIGLVVTIGSFQSAAASPTGGTVIVAFGAIIWGAVQFLTGLSQLTSHIRTPDWVGGLVIAVICVAAAYLWLAQTRELNDAISSAPGQFEKAMGRPPQEGYGLGVALIGWRCGSETKSNVEACSLRCRNWQPRQGRPLNATSPCDVCAGFEIDLKDKRCVLFASIISVTKKANYFSEKVP